MNLLVYWIRIVLGKKENISKGMPHADPPTGIQLLCVLIYADSAISGSLANQEFCFPKATGKTEGFLDSNIASEAISKHLVFKKIFWRGRGVCSNIASKNFPGGEGGCAPWPPYLLRAHTCSLLFTAQICAPHSNKFSYAYARSKELENCGKKGSS